jgi:hypothetical protein
LSLIGDVVTRRQGWERKNFQYGGQTKNWKKVTLDENSNAGPPSYGRS